MNHERARNQVDRLFTNGLPALRHRRLRDHLRECDGCRRYYEGVRELEDTMFAEPAALNDAALARMADLAVEQRPRHERKRVPTWLAMLATSATAAAALLIVVGPRETPEEFTARGGAAVAGAGLTVFHIDRESRNVTRVARQGAVLPGDAVVQLGVTTNEKLVHLAVLGVDEAYRAQWYQTPTTVPAGVIDEVVGGAWKLTAGRLRIFAVFSEAPLDRGALDAAAAKLRGADLAATERLPGIAAHQDSILIEVGR